jgi:hypothetical protein
VCAGGVSTGLCTLLDVLCQSYILTLISPLCCICRRSVQLNGLDIGDGCVIQVSPAEFDHRDSGAPVTAASPSQPGPPSQASFLSTVSVAPGPLPPAVPPASTLPAECEGHKYPVVVIENVYTSADAAAEGESFFVELQVRSSVIFAKQ